MSGMSSFFFELRSCLECQALAVLPAGGIRVRHPFNKKLGEGFSLVLIIF
jgi:hypothetical protein